MRNSNSRRRPIWDLRKRPAWWLTTLRREGNARLAMRGLGLLCLDRRTLGDGLRRSASLIEDDEREPPFQLACRSLIVLATVGGPAPMLLQGPAGVRRVVSQLAGWERGSSVAGWAACRGARKSPGSVPRSRALVLMKMNAGVDGEHLAGNTVAPAKRKYLLGDVVGACSSLQHGALFCHLNDRLW
jgi:hypothetical protein